jgi:hypothetical protein
MDPLAAATASAADLKLLVSTGNIVFPLTLLLLLAGQFNYGKRGILDLTRSSLFAFPTIGPASRAAARPRPAQGRRSTASSA